MIFRWVLKSEPIPGGSEERGRGICARFEGELNFFVPKLLLSMMGSEEWCMNILNRGGFDE